MPSSKARASQINARRPIGPGTPGDKATKHGPTGAGVVLPNEDAAEVERRLAAFQDELKPSGEVGKALVRRAAICSVRMDRSVEQETAALSERGFFRALKELRQLEGQARDIDPAVQEEVFRQELGSFLSQGESLRAMDAELDAMETEFGELDPGPAVATPEMISRAIARAYASAPGGRVDVPFTIGRTR
jgi:hypothetical protein